VIDWLSMCGSHARVRHLSVTCAAIDLQKFSRRCNKLLTTI